MLKEPEDRLFKIMADQVTDYAIFLLSPEGLVLSWNAGAAKIKGFVAGDIIGKHFSTFYTQPDIDRRWPDHELRLARTEGRFEDAGWRMRKDGSRFWANVIITALRDEKGELLAFSKITRDLTTRREQEEELRQSEERFRLLVEGVQDYAVYMLSPEGIVTSWNTGARRIKGYDAADIIGRHFSQFYSSEDIDANKPWAELAMAREHGRAEEEGWRLRKDGSRFWARVVVTALYDATGALHGFAKVTQDLTQRRQSEALAETASKVNDFIAILAHELRNPLAPIRNAVRLQLLPNVDQDKKTMASEIIDRQSAQLSRIVDDLLDITRINRGTFSVEHAPCDIANVIEHAIETSRPGIEAARHTLDVEILDKHLVVEGDELRLAQVLSNLINNAVRYTPVGGHITVTASRQQGREGHPEVHVSVADNGRGIAPEMIKPIFGLFVQAKDHAARPSAGLGVGLALARSIVELHHGTLEASSAGIGQGAEFVIKMPLLKSASRLGAGAPVVSEESAPQLSRRVLVVDDSEDAAEGLSGLLSARGHLVKTAHDGGRAIEIFTEFCPDIVLLDIGMPGMSGLEVARRLRERNRIPRPFIVAVTGWGKAEDEARTQDAGFDLHLVKPVEEKQIMEILGALPSAGNQVFAL
ncbi:MAG: chemotaxis protein CheY [Betaproteobacteria bacterium]|nr:chemotaxis protein CheY [Betaproteobacteria bacterium]